MSIERYYKFISEQIYKEGKYSPSDKSLQIQSGKFSKDIKSYDVEKTTSMRPFEPISQDTQSGVSSRGMDITIPKSKGKVTRQINPETGEETSKTTTFVKEAIDPKLKKLADDVIAKRIDISTFSKEDQEYINKAIAEIGDLTSQINKKVNNTKDQISSLEQDKGRVLPPPLPGFKKGSAAYQQEKDRSDAAISSAREKIKQAGITAYEKEGEGGESDRQTKSVVKPKPKAPETHKGSSLVLSASEKGNGDGSGTAEKPKLLNPEKKSDRTGVQTIKPSPNTLDVRPDGTITPPEPKPHGTEPGDVNNEPPEVKAAPAEEPKAVAPEPEKPSAPEPKTTKRERVVSAAKERLTRSQRMSKAMHSGDLQGVVSGTYGESTEIK